MAMRFFVDGMNNTPCIVHRGKDRIEGTKKCRTYTSNHSIYSKESNIETLIKHRRGTHKYTAK